MANSFNITITAVDKATAVVRSVKASFGSFMQPITQFRTSMSKLSKEAGLDKVGKGLAKVSKFAGDAFGVVQKLVGPMGIMAGGVTIAGIAELAQNWAKLGFNITQSSANLGMTTTRFQQMAGAAKLFGVDGDAATASLMSLNQTVNDARWGRNQGALAMMNQLGLRFRYTKDGAVDTKAMLMQLSAVMQRLGPQQQQMVAQAFGVEALLTELRAGPAAVQDAMDRAQRSAQSPEQIATAKKMTDSLNDLWLSVSGVWNNIAGRIFPQLTQITSTVSDFIVKNQDDLGRWGAYLLKAPIFPLLLSNRAAGWGQEFRQVLETQFAGLVPFFKKLWDNILIVFRNAITQAQQMAGNLVPPGLQGLVGLGRSGLAGMAAGAGVGASGPAARALPGNLVTVKSRNGVSFAVDSRYAQNFLGFVNDLEATGYDVRSVMGYQPRNVAGTNVPSYHAQGAAIDVNPTQNPVGSLGNLPPNVRAIARKWGLGWGEDWRTKKDPMHFSIASQEGGSVPLSRYGGGPGGRPAMGSVGGEVSVNVTVQHNGSHATATTRATGNVRAHGRVVRSLNAVPA
jgi:hypothetical protein